AVDRDDRVATGADVDALVDHVVGAGLEARAGACRAGGDLVDQCAVAGRVPEPARDRGGQILGLDPDVGVLGGARLLERLYGSARRVDRNGEADALEAGAGA